MDNLKRIITEFELHSTGGIKEYFEKGVSPNEKINGRPLIYELINMYTRGPLFKECVKAFVDYGLEFNDKPLLAVLSDDATTLDKLLKEDNSALEKKYSLDAAFTPLYEASLLHICAEYNHLACAKILVTHGMDVNSKAGLDENQFGGQTPIFHTVNQHANASWDVLEFLIAQNADLEITVKGLVWGKGYDWETFIPSINPVSYAMMGLLRQFQRTEKQIYEVVSLLLKAKYGIDYLPGNVLNKYLGS
jgi:hypothetical protein